MTAQGMVHNVKAMKGMIPGIRTTDRWRTSRAASGTAPSNR